jgi:hypothetical protein
MRPCGRNRLSSTTVDYECKQPSKYLAGFKPTTDINSDLMNAMSRSRQCLITAVVSDPYP